MGYAGIVGWVRLETNRKDVVAIIACNVQIVGPGFVVLQMQSR